MPLYEQLKEEQRMRREQVRHMNREYLNSISKPFGFESREKAKTILRRHSYSDGDIIRPGTLFKARTLPVFYQQQHQDNEEYEITSIVFLFVLILQHFRMKEQALYRSIRRDLRAKELLKKSRLPFSSSQSKRSRRSMSANDLARMNYQEYSFKPKTNGYYVPNYDKLHSKFLHDAEQAKRTRSTTKCKPFLLYTNLIPSKKDKILDDIQKDANLKHSKTFQIKGKQMPTKSASLVNLSTSSQQSEAIPTKTTEAQRLREALGKKKRRQKEVQDISENTFQRSQSAKERRVREKLREKAKLQDQAVVLKAKREERVIR